MSAGAIVSGIGHMLVLGAAVLGVPWLSSRERAPITVAEVRFVTAAEFEAAQAGASAAPPAEAAAPSRPASPPLESSPPSAAAAAAPPAPEPPADTPTPSSRPDPKPAPPLPEPAALAAAIPDPAEPAPAPPAQQAAATAGPRPQARPPGLVAVQDALRDAPQDAPATEPARVARETATEDWQPAAAGGVSGPVGAAALQAWAAQIQRSLQRNLVPPRGRVPDGATVLLALSVAPDGRLRSATILRPSSAAALDAATLETIRRLGRLPPAPEGLTGAAYDFEAPVVFRGP